MTHPADGFLVLLPKEHIPSAQLTALGSPITVTIMTFPQERQKGIFSSNQEIKPEGVWVSALQPFSPNIKGQCLSFFWRKQYAQKNFNCTQDTFIKQAENLACILEMTTMGSS